MKGKAKQQAAAEPDAAANANADGDPPPEEAPDDWVEVDPGPDPSVPSSMPSGSQVFLAPDAGHPDGIGMYIHIQQTCGIALDTQRMTTSTTIGTAWYNGYPGGLRQYWTTLQNAPAKQTSLGRPMSDEQKVERLRVNFFNAASTKSISTHLHHCQLMNPNRFTFAQAAAFVESYIAQEETALLQHGPNTFKTSAAKVNKVQADHPHTVLYLHYNVGAALWPYWAAVQVCVWATILWH